MIFDKLPNWRKHDNLKHMESAFNFLENKTNYGLAQGKVEIGPGIHAVISKYSTEPASSKRFEAHRNFVDIHYIVSGVEIIEWTPIGSLEGSSNYDPESDCIFYEKSKGSSKIAMWPGDFIVLMPNDGHKPGCHYFEPSEVHKIVVKVDVKLV